MDAKGVHWSMRKTEPLQCLRPVDHQNSDGELLAVDDAAVVADYEAG